MSLSNTPGRRTRLSVTPLEDRTTPSATATAAASGPYAVGVPDGQTGDVVVYNADGSELYQVADPYGASFTGGVRVALADVNGDGVADLITAPGAGTAPVVNVYDGASLGKTLITSFDAYDASFTGGVNVAAADLNGDGDAEIVTGADQGGGPRVRVFDGASVASGSTSPTTLDDFLAIDDPNFRGGVRISLGDINGDGVPDLLVGAGYGGGPRVTAYDGASLGTGTQVKLFNDMFVFEGSLRNGVYVGVGDVSGDGTADLIFGAGPGGAPRVLALSGQAALDGQFDPVANFYAGNSASRDGVQVGALTAADGTTSIVTLDRQTDATGVYDATGQDQGDPASTAGMLACEPPAGTTGSTGGSTTGGSTTTPVAPSSTTLATLDATYTGSGTGTLVTFSADSQPTSTTPDVTISVQITSATLNGSSTSTGSSDSSDSTGTSSAGSDDTGPSAPPAPPAGVTVTGTITITVAGGTPVTESFTGQFVSTSDSADTLQGVLHITQLGSGGRGQMSTQGFALDATVADGSLTVQRFTTYDQTGQSAGTILRVPATAGGDTITLSRS